MVPPVGQPVPFSLLCLHECLYQSASCQKQQVYPPNREARIRVEGEKYQSDNYNLQIIQLSKIIIKIRKVKPDFHAIYQIIKFYTLIHIQVTFSFRNLHLKCKCLYISCLIQYVGFLSYGLIKWRKKNSCFLKLYNYVILSFFSIICIIFKIPVLELVETLRNFIILKMSLQRISDLGFPWWSSG